MTTRHALASTARAAAGLVRVVASAVIANAVIATAFIVTAVIATGCSSGPECWRIGYEKTGTTPEAGRADLAAAMQEAGRRYPPPPVSTDPAVANQIALRRVEHVRASMESRGYKQVRIPVDCETGATLPDDR